MIRKAISKLTMIVSMAWLAVGASMTPALAAGTPNGQTLNGHAVMVDGSNKIVSWVANQDQAYDAVAGLTWNYLLHQVPNDPATGQPAYLSRSYIDPNTQAMAGWPSNPAGLNAMLIESALRYYQYSGNAEVLGLAKRVADNHLANGMTLATDNWANVPYSSGDAGSLTYHGASYGNSTGVGDGAGYLEPDKVGEFGQALLKLYEQTGITAYRDAAINAANALASHVQPGSTNASPWPYRVNAATGAVREAYTAHVIAPIELFDELMRLGLGNVSAYQTARTTAWNWMMQYPMVNNYWSGYFEDVPIKTSPSSNRNQLLAMMTARYLLQHPETDPSWETHVRGLISWVESVFGVGQYGATTVKEQEAFMHVMGSHTSRYASINALLYEKTGDVAAKEKAYRAFNWATYMTRPNGVGIDGPTVNNEWFTDSYGDYIRHFMVGMGAVPEWAPAGQTHMVAGTSVVTSMTYAPTGVNYTTFDASGIEKFKLGGTPTGVTAGGVALAQRSDLAAEGWVYDAATGVLSVRHDVSGTVAVGLDGVPANLAPNVSLSAPNNSYTAPAGFTLSAAASDADGTVNRVEFYQGATLLGTSTTAPYNYAVSNLVAGTYSFTAKAYDNLDAVGTSNTVNVTVTDPAGPSSWTGVDVGTVGVAGSTTTSGGTVTVKGSGVDIWGTADSFHYGYQQMTGNGEIKARVLTQQNTDQWALAGVMMRESLTAGSKEVLAAMTPGHGLALDYRTATNGQTTYVSGGNATLPYWVRLVRSGNTVTASKSANGTTWTNMGSATVSMASTIYVGLAVTSHVNSVLGTATFDNVSFTGQPTADTTPPMISGVTAVNPSQNGATINWTTNEPATSQVEYGPTTSYGSSTAVNTTLETAHAQVVAGLDEATTYHYRVRSVDAAGNVAASGDFTFNTPAQPDTQPPSVPDGLAATGVSPVQVNVSWNAATDNVGVTKYVLKRDGVAIAEPTGTSYSDLGRTSGTSYSYTVAALDAAGNMSTDSEGVNVTTPADTTAPNAPTSLVATAASQTQVSLSWTAATDDVGVVQYNILRDGALVGTTTGTSFSDNGLLPGMNYNYTVAAQDAAGNVSAVSNTATVTTLTAQPLAVDTQVIKHTTSSSTSIVSPALTTAAGGELLVAFLASDGPNGSGTSSFNAVTGGGLTWTMRKRANTQAGTSEIWTAVANAKLTNVTITATRSGSYRSSLVVTAFKGVDLTAIGAVASASANTGAPSVSLTTTRAGSWVWGVGNDWDNAIARTVGSGQIKVDEFLTASGDTLWMQRRTAVTPAAGTVVTLNDTAPTSDRWNLAAIEILPAP